MLQVLKKVLPEKGYKLVEDKEYNSACIRTEIVTPSGDEIILRTKNFEYDRELLSDKEILYTANVMGQDKKETQPDLFDDELIKLAKNFNENDEIDVSIIFSDKDCRT